MRGFGTLLSLVFALGLLLSPVRAERVVIKGSNTFGEELGPRLIDAFRERNPEVEVELETKGSASGFRALLEGESDIASSSRPATEDELRLARSRGIEMRLHTVGYYGVAVIVNDANPLRNLSSHQVRDIFIGLIDNWMHLGWADRPIQTYIRHPASGTYLGFQELAMENHDYVASAKKLHSYSAIAEAVAMDQNGTGYVGMHVARREGVHPVSINGMPPTVESVNEGFYPYARLLRLYTNKDKENPGARAFIEFVQSKEGQRILERLGFVPRMHHRITPPPGPYF